MWEMQEVGGITLRTLSAPVVLRRCHEARVADQLRHRSNVGPCVEPVAGPGPETRVDSMLAEARGFAEVEPTHSPTKHDLPRAADREQERSHEYSHTHQ